VLSRRRIDELHRWGSGLARSGASEEVRAAGRAIQLLVDHIDALELTRRSDAESGDDVLPAPPSNADPSADKGSVLGALADRIGTRP
jgi:hypothetical protein